MSHTNLSILLHFASMRPKIFNFATFQIHSSSSKIIANDIPQDHLGYPNSSEPLLLLTNDLKIYLGSFNSSQDLHSFIPVADVRKTICFDVSSADNLIFADCMIKVGIQQINQLFIFNASNHSDFSVTNSSSICKIRSAIRTERGLKAFQFSNGTIYLFRYQQKSASCDCISGGFIEIWKLASMRNLTLVATIQRDCMEKI